MPLLQFLYISPFCFTACVYYRYFNGYHCFSGSGLGRTRHRKGSKCGGFYPIYDHHWRYHYRNHWCVFAHDILELLGTDPKVMHLSLPYVQWMLAGSPLLFVYIIYTSILRGVGDSTTPLLALALTSVIGVIITPILLKGYFGFPALGIIAPAIASIISYIAILIFLAIYLNKKKHPLRPNRQLLQHIRHNSALSKIILRLGVPTGIQMITTSMAGLVIVGLVNRFGAHATAAYGAVNQVLNYIQFPAISISIAASIFAAQAIGAGKSDLLARVTRTALGMNFLFTGALIALGYLFSKYLMALFITDPTVVVLGQQLLFIVLWAILFFGAGAIFASIMRASGTVTVPMLINISAILFIEMPCAYWFSSMWGLKAFGSPMPWHLSVYVLFKACIINLFGRKRRSKFLFRMH